MTPRPIRLFTCFTLLIYSSFIFAIDSPFKSNHFTEQVAFSNDVATGDLNGDGYTDLFVVSGFYPHKVYFNNTKAQFFPSKQSFGLERGAKVVLQDFDGDGDLDAWVGVDTIHAIFKISDQIYLNDGKGHFVSTNQNIGPIDNFGYRKVATLIAGDLDNDGDLDIVRSTNENTSSIFINDGTGNFIENNQDFVFLSAALGDYNGDGYLDLWTVGRSLTIYLNDKKGTFDSNRTVTSPFGSEIWSRKNVVNMLVKDIDADGDLDVQVFTKRTIGSGGDPIPGQPLVRLPRYINNSDGTFFYQDIKQAADTGSVSNGILFDLDNDSDLDLWALGNWGQPSGIYLTKDDGFFNTDSEIIIDDKEFRSGVSATDLDNDGDLDIVTVGYNGSITVWINNDFFNFNISQQPVLNQVTGRSNSLASADFNQDGFLDFVSADINGITLNIGNGRNSFEQFRFSDKNYTKIIAIDFDSDGYPDLATTSKSSIEIWLNNKNQSFSLLPQDFYVGSNARFRHLSAADYDEDGDQDLLISQNYNGPIKVYYNDGSAHFTFKQTLPNAGHQIKDAKFIDMNNDGKIEILTVTSYDIYSIYEFNGESFNLIGTYDASDDNYPDFQAELITFDWDNDGDIDIFKKEYVRDVLNPTGTVLINSGHTFIKQQVRLSDSDGNRVRISAAEDFNGDGAIDFYTTRNVVLINDGNNNFEATAPKHKFSPDEVLFADFDHDGDDDLVTVDFNYGIQRFINTTIDQDFSGLWFNPLQNGHGIQIDELYIQGSKQLFLSWYVYQNGKPVWISGLGTLVHNKAEINVIITEGTGFLPDFMAEKVNRIPWGVITVEMLDKNNINFSWDTTLDGFSSGNMPMQRITSIGAVGIDLSGIRSCHSGSWYNPDQSGHGMMVEIIGATDQKRMIMTWFAYLNGEQYWILAQGDIVGNKAVLSANAGTGGNFPPNFDADQVNFDSWGEITFELIDDTNAKISWNPTNEDFTSGQLDVSKLTFVDRYNCN